jgi:alkanesulfonate monooxygenase SsuD/methylene tetrahydromethanopterin reductase-like flavin-dependent oxidoreductase (luciferase family)
MDIGQIGVWTSYRPFGADRAGEAAKLAEQLGYGAWWVGASPHVPDIRPVLEATSNLTAATGILNVWSNDPAETAAADAVAREYATLYLGLSNYTQALRDFGFTDDDFADGGSDRLLDAVIPRGSAEEIAEHVRAHLDAGADHVCLQPLGEEGIPRESWTALAKALIR